MKSVWVKKRKVAQFLGEEFRVEKYVQEDLWVKSLWVKIYG